MRSAIKVETKHSGMPLSISYGFNGNIVNRLTHKEKRGGYIYTIEDGYEANDILLNSCTLSYILGDADHPCTVNGDDLVDVVKDFLKTNGYQELESGKLLSGRFYKEEKDPVDNFVNLKKTVTISFDCPNRVTYLTIKCRIDTE